MTPDAPRPESTARSGLVLPLTIAGALAALVLLLWPHVLPALDNLLNRYSAQVAERNVQPHGPLAHEDAVHINATAVPAPPSAATVPAWAALVLAACALAAAWFAYVAGRDRARLQVRIARLAADSTRIALGEYGWRAGPPGDAALEPLADALNRLASLVGTAESTIVDHELQLAAMRGLGDMCYWETDVDGRFTRIEYEPSWPLRRRAKQIGRPQFEGTQPLDQERWQAAREAIARHCSFRNLPLERSDAEGRKVYDLESGRPRFGRDGRFMGFGGVTRMIAPDSSVFVAASARIAVQTSSEAMLLIALDGDDRKILHSNAAARRLLEYEAAALEAQPLQALFADDQAPALADLERALDEHRPLRRLIALRNRFGERIAALVRLEPVPQHPNLSVLTLDPREPKIAALRARSKSEEALRAHLADRTRRLEQLSREAETFASSVSHDLRAPLRAVDGFARLLLENHSTQLDAAAREYLAHILTGCTRMSDMIDAVLELSRLTFQPLSAIPVDLGRIAHEVVEALARDEPARRVEVRIGEDLQTHGDPALLRIVLENLLGNAWKYTATVPQPSIELDATTDAQGRRVFCVSDNGVGFDMRHVDRLFDLYQRLHDEERFPGSGIGLATVKRIVERHGGAIWANSAPGTGSRFHFFLGSAADDAGSPTACGLCAEDTTTGSQPQTCA